MDPIERHVMAVAAAQAEVERARAAVLAERARWVNTGAVAFLSLLCLWAAASGAPFDTGLGILGSLGMLGAVVYTATGWLEAEPNRPAPRAELDAARERLNKITCGEDDPS
jgi:hypothetical protein